MQARLAITFQQEQPMVPADGRIQKIKTTKAREEFGSVVDRVAYTKRPVLLERRGKPLAVLVPLEDYRLLEKLIEEEEDRIDAEEGEKALRESTESVPWEEFRKELGLDAVHRHTRGRVQARRTKVAPSHQKAARRKAAGAR
jgi:prevent-host-death family protein